MKILEIEILTNNLPETEKFYAKILCFEVDNKTEHSITFKIGSSKLTFTKTALNNPVYHFAFEIPYNLLEEAIVWIADKAELIKLDNNTLITHFEDWNAKSIYFYDNNGNILEFIVRYDNTISSAAAFTQHQILCVSEIAFVTDSVEKLVSELKMKTGLDYFSKHAPCSDFSVLGNNTGLLLISVEDRAWYPTQIKAKKFTVKVKLKSDRRTIEYQYK